MRDIKVPNVNERERIPPEAIQAVADHIAERFDPEKTILFGSYACGDPKPWSDVDLLVVMDTPDGNLQQMLAVSRALSPHPFGLEILVHSPKAIRERITAGDIFLKEIMTRGRVLYERRNR